MLQGLDNNKTCILVVVTVLYKSSTSELLLRFKFCENQNKGGAKGIVTWFATKLYSKLQGQPAK